MRGKPSKRIDTRAPAAPLTDNPFAKLTDHPAASEAPESAPPDPPPAGNAPAPKWRVARTRKGGWPLRLEKRPGNRSATVIGGVSGDGAALLALLKRRCGAGGVLREETIELQGDHRAAVQALLDAQDAPD